MLRHLALLAPLAALIFIVSPARAEDDDEEDAPTLIREHGAKPDEPEAPSAAERAKKPARGRASGAEKPRKGTSAAKKDDEPEPPTLEVKVHEGEPAKAPPEALDDEPEREPPPAPRVTEREEPAPPMVSPDDPTIAPDDPSLARPRTSLPDVELDGTLPWQRHGEFGAELAWLSRPFSNALGPVRTNYRPTFGLGVHLQWDVRPWLHVRPYFLWGAHNVEVGHGALSTASPSSIRPDAIFDAIQAATFTFGVKLAPTWNVSPRARVWFVAGVGYGRSSFRNMTITEPGGKPFTVPDRDGVFVDFPLGLGGAYEVLPGRAAFTFEVTGAPAVGQTGTAYEPFQVVDTTGKLRELGPFGAVQATFVQTLGLAIYL
ncbi:MAG: hypothetical protein FJ096_10970 [Deltaproteobacteria bacterium]|nr:hypothetical protein [Deltaproteobacteria bacterium]